MKNRLLCSNLAKLLLLWSVIVSSGNPLYAQGNEVKKRVNTQPFQAISIKGTLKVNVRKGNSCVVEIDSNYLNKVRWIVADGVLLLACIDGSCSHTETVDLFLPSLKRIDINGTVATTISGFDLSDSFTFNSFGASVSAVHVNAGKLTVNLFNTSTLTISGETNYLKLFSTDASIIKGYSLAVKDASISCSKVANIQLTVNGSLSAVMNNNSQLHYRGKPVIKKIVTAGQNFISSES